MASRFRSAVMVFPVSLKVKEWKIRKYFEPFRTISKRGAGNISVSMLDSLTNSESYTSEYNSGMNRHPPEDHPYVNHMILAEQTRIDHGAATFRTTIWSASEANSPSIYGHSGWIRLCGTHTQELSSCLLIWLPVRRPESAGPCVGRSGR